ncbi:MAG: ECF transporter S component, partial [Eubacterium sp.]|nr:ECF transporter S component [Eubacterium sp.]
MKTKDITFMAAGIALFVILSMCLRVPVFENYYLCLGYVVMTLYIWCYKWYEGAVIGFFGVILYCLIGGLGFNGMPGWAVGNVVIGLLLGITLKFIQKINRKPVQVFLLAIAAVAAAFVGIEWI